MEVAAQRESLPGRVIGVAFAPPASVALFEGRLDLGVPILCDPDRAWYHALGFGRGGWKAFVSPTFWRRTITAALRGRQRRLRPQEDPGQLGGDVVVDAGHRLRWIYRSRYPADRPSVSEVRNELARLAADR